MHKFEPQHLERLLSGERLKDISPAELLAKEGLKEGMAFIDIGCGPGFFTFPAAAIVGPLGAVYAVDTEERMIEELKRRNPPPAVRALRSGEHAFPVPDSSADFALIAYVLHETEDKGLFLKETHRVLKAAGRLVLLEWKKKEEEKGPPLDERLGESEVLRMLRAAGFKSAEASSLNESHYRVSAVKAA
jgi:ubiquinone/menaquinone biosynthesis C-methylase UbiE